LIGCRLSDNTLHRALAGFAGMFPEAEAIQLVRDLRQEEFRASVRIADAAVWLAELDNSTPDARRRTPEKPARQACRSAAARGGV